MDPRIKSNNPGYNENQSKLSEVGDVIMVLLGILLIFGAISFIFIKFFLNSNQEDPNKPPVISDGSSIEIIDSKDGSDCSTFEQSAKNLFTTPTTDRKWYLIGNEFSDEERRAAVNTTISSPFEEVSKGIKRYEIKFAFIGSSEQIKAIPGENGSFSAFLPTKEIEPGVQKIVAIADTSCGKVTSEAHEVNISYPIYVVWTLDWEGKYVAPGYIPQIDQIANKHGIKATHFFNPRFLISPTSEGDKQRYLEFVTRRRDENGDSIGLHLHMFYDFVRNAGLEPQTAPAWGWPNGANELGYDVIVSGYPYESMDIILDYSAQLFEENGLAKPTTFRAGGWHANIDTLRALEDNGFLVDSSGRERFTLGSNNIPVPWLLESTTQPYRPAYYSQNETDAKAKDQMKIWEFPNNGLDSTANNYKVLYQKFVDNYDGSPLTERKTINYLSHPDYFNLDVNNGVDTLFTLIDESLYSSDSGPVIYEQLDNVYKAFTIDVVE